MSVLAPTRGKRKKATTCPNPLFVQWLTEWKEEAQLKGWKSSYTYSMALSSLKKYPLPLVSGKECKSLMHFGDKICSMLDRKLQDHKALGPSLTTLSSSDTEEEPAAAPVGRVRRKAAAPGTPAGSVSDDGVSPRNKSMSRARPYVPAHRSGAYAILTTLYKYTKLEQCGDYMNKTDLIRLAQPHCDKSLTVPDPGSYYTAFSSMSTLISKHLVEKFSSPAKYRLTEEGSTLAQSILTSSSSNNPTTSPNSSVNEYQSPVDKCQPPATQCQPPASTSLPNDIPSQPSTSRQCTSTTQKSRNKSGEVPSVLGNANFSVQQVNPISAVTGPQTTHQPPATSCHSDSVPLFSMYSHQYEIVLVVDNREHYGFGRAKQHILPGLLKNGVNFDLRPISVGDFVWIAKSESGDGEAVLDYIVERKRLDDLSGSIVDGRYKEQKLRMKESGLRKPIYLIEYYKNQDNERIKEQTLLQAVMNTQIIDGFYTKRCNGIHDCIAYLTLLHKQICQLYQSKTIHVYSRDALPDIPFDATSREMCHLTYSEFNSDGVRSKVPTVLEAWTRSLLVIPGVSVEKAYAITDLYPTPTSLMEAYSRCESDAERKKLFSKLTFGSSKRKFGDVLSRNICSLMYSATPLQ